MGGDFLMVACLLRVSQDPWKKSGFQLVARDPLVDINCNLIMLDPFLWDIKSLGIDFLVMPKFQDAWLLHPFQPKARWFFPRANAPFMSCIGSFPP